VKGERVKQGTGINGKGKRRKGERREEKGVG
jgi:hypothetical protein